ncbi:hypothetical protein [Methylobacterium sp. sgz302541]|uniref:hypothetical protein n=1 Tax=unclassified Methylobacterium TaxID=2615210 RepID=UPI003D32DA77
MTKIALSAGALMLAATLPALAQANPPAEIRQPAPPSVAAPDATGSTFVKPGGLDNGGPGSVGTVARSGLGADSTSNNSGADANSGKPELAVPNAGGGGGR